MTNIISGSIRESFALCRDVLRFIFGCNIQIFKKSIHLLITKRPQYHKAETEINAHSFCFRSVFVLLLCNLGQVTRSLS